MTEKKTEIGRITYTSNSYDIFSTSPLDGTIVKQSAEDIGLPLAVLSWGEALRYDSNWFKHINYYRCALEMILEGEMVYLCSGRRFVVKKGELFLMASGSSVRYKRTECKDPIHKIHLIFSGPFVRILLYFLGIQEAAHFKVDSPERFEKMIREIGRLMEEKTPSSLRRSSVLLYDLLLELSVFAETQEHLEEKRLQNMIRFQDLQISQPLANRDLEKLLFLKHSALNELYRKKLGSTPHRFHLNRRLEQAAELLRTTSISVKDTASECGFANYKYFLTVFKKQFGLSPGKYRSEQKKEGLSEENPSEKPPPSPPLKESGPV